MLFLCLPFYFKKNTCNLGEYVVIYHSHGGVAHLGERLNGIQEVRGSIPLISTKKGRTCYGLAGSFFVLNI